MVSQKDLDYLESVEAGAYRLYHEAHLRANTARKELAIRHLKERGIKLNKTLVYVINFNAKETRCIIRDINKEGKVICFPADQDGKATSNSQAACCPVYDAHLTPQTKEST